VGADTGMNRSRSDLLRAHGRGVQSSAGMVRRMQGPLQRPNNDAQDIRMKVKVSSNTAERLVIVLRPLAAGILVPFAVSLAATAAIVIWLIGSSFNVSVADGIFRYDVRFLGVIPTQTFEAPVAAVQEVDLVMETALGFINTYQIRMVTTQADILVKLPFADGDEKQLLADELRLTMSDEGDGELSYGENSIVVALLLAATCLIGAAYTLRALQTVRVVGDRTRSQLSVRMRRTFSRGESRTDVPLADVRQVTIVSNQALSTTPSYAVAIRTRNGKTVPLSFGPIFTEESAMNTKMLLDGWLAPQVNPGA
jgi:hypothetical protein